MREIRRPPGRELAAQRICLSKKLLLTVINVQGLERRGLAPDRRLVVLCCSLLREPISPFQKMPTYKFGAFEFDSVKFRLLKYGTRIKLQRKPQMLLVALLEEPGKTVHRQELYRRLWPDSTSVDFEKGLNVAVKKLRDALGDSSDQPRYIDTVAGSGYRFIEEVEESRLELATDPETGVGNTIAHERHAAEFQTALSRWHHVTRWQPLVSMSMVAVMLIATVLFLVKREQASVPHRLRAVIKLPSDLRLMTRGENAGIAVSPDGSKMVFSAVRAGGRTQLWMRELDSLSAEALPGTEDGSFPFWSPDGKELGFFTQQQLKKVNLASRQVKVICGVNSPRGGAWSKDGVILFARSTQEPLYKVSSAGGAPVPLTSLQKGQTTHRWPAFLPDQKHFVFLAASHENNSVPGAIYLGNLADDKPKQIGEADSNIVPAGNSLLFVSDGKLISQRLDLERSRMDSRANIVAESVEYDPGLWNAAFSASPNVVVYHGRPLKAERETISWFDAAGKRIRDVGRPGIYRSVSLSPDGKTIAALCGDPQVNVCLLHEDGTVTELNHGGISTPPHWAGDSSAVAYATHRSHTEFAVYIKPLGDTRPERMVINDVVDVGPLAWHPDNHRLLLQREAAEGQYELETVDLQGGFTTSYLPAAGALYSGASFSPDGGWLAYSKVLDGKSQVWVTSYPLAGNTYQVAEAGSAPKWRGDGRELFFLGGDENLYSVPISMGEGRLTIGRPRKLFQPPIFPAPWDSISFDVAQDGRRFVVNTIGSAAPAELMLTANWQQ